MILLAGRPTRELLSTPPDPINLEYESKESLAAADDEIVHWARELGGWDRFLKWRKWKFDHRPKDAPDTHEPRHCEPSKMEAYALHLKFRTLLLESAEAHKRDWRLGWPGSRARLDTLELQLVELRAERGLPAPPPPALVALRVSEQAEKAVKLGG